LPKAKIKRLYLIPILSKALDVLEFLEQSHAPVTLEDVYQKTQISKTSVYRILKTLVHRGYVAQAQNGTLPPRIPPTPPAFRLRRPKRGNALLRRRDSKHHRRSRGLRR
jgi:predicted ArsR family transcriptional regulator